MICRVRSNRHRFRFMCTSDHKFSVPPNHGENELAVMDQPTKPASCLLSSALALRFLLPGKASTQCAAGFLSFLSLLLLCVVWGAATSYTLWYSGIAKMGMQTGISILTVHVGCKIILKKHICPPVYLVTRDPEVRQQATRWRIGHCFDFGIINLIDGALIYRIYSLSFSPPEPFALLIRFQFHSTPTRIKQNEYAIHTSN